MEDIVRSGEPQTPYLHPQALPEEDEQVPDFFLDEDAGVGSPIDFSEEQSESAPSLSTILALGQALSPCPSPAPSLVSDVSLLSEVSVMSESECSDGTFKKKKLVRFLHSVEIVPYDRSEPKSMGPLKPPQEPQYEIRRFHGSSYGDYSKSEDIGILYGLGRAGSPRSSSLLYLQQREFNTRRPASPPTDISESESEDEDTLFGPRVKQYHRRDLLTVPLFPPPSWRTNPEEKPHHEHPPRVKSPGEMDGYVGYEDARYILGQTSPTSPSSPISLSPPPPFSLPFPSPLQPGDGVYRRESNLRNSQEYNNSYSFHHPQPQRHTEAIKAYSYWRDGEIRYEDQWGRRIYPRNNSDGSAGGKNNGELEFDLWPVKGDPMGENGMGGGNAAVPGGRMTLREERSRMRGIRRR